MGNIVIGMKVGHLLVHAGVRLCSERGFNIDQQAHMHCLQYNLQGALQYITPLNLLQTTEWFIISELNSENGFNIDQQLHMHYLQYNLQGALQYITPLNLRPTTEWLIISELTSENGINVGQQVHMYCL